LCKKRPEYQKGAQVYGFFGALKTLLKQQICTFFSQTILTTKQFEEMTQYQQRFRVYQAYIKA
jgi:hypothetical protein